MKLRKCPSLSLTMTLLVRLSRYVIDRLPQKLIFGLKLKSFDFKPSPNLLQYLGLKLVLVSFGLKLIFRQILAKI